MHAEHQHILIPEIVKGRVQDNVGMRPGTNICTICGEIVADQQIVLTQWDEFLIKEMIEYDSCQKS